MLQEILERLVINIQGGDLTSYSREMIDDAKQEIEKLLLDRMNNLIDWLRAGYLLEIICQEVKAYLAQALTQAQNRERMR